MSEFKKGDYVVRTGKSVGDVKSGDTYLVSDIPVDGNLMLEGSAIVYDASKFRLAQRTGLVQPEPAQVVDWNYAEAQRLADAADAAIEAYNVYIQKQPKTVFIPKIK